MSTRREFLKKSLLASTAVILPSLWAPKAAFALKPVEKDPYLKTRGIVVDTNDLSTGFDWPKFCSEIGLTTIGTHFGPAMVVPFMQADVGKKFFDDCVEYGLEVEHELHSMTWLLPRDLFEKNPEMFRMDENGQRVKEANCCISSPAAIEEICKNAVRIAKICRSTTHRYFFWIDDGQPMCLCPKCREYSFTDQALILENAMLKALRAEVAPDATLAHLAYAKTMEPPKTVKPDPGIFLEFAPLARKRNISLATDCKDTTDTLSVLDANLQVFPQETAQVLEYWLDVSLFSNWKEPHIELPWYPDVCREDIEVYGKRGIRNFTSFGVYMDGPYMKKFPNVQDSIREYSQILAAYQPGKQDELEK